MYYLAPGVVEVRDEPIPAHGSNQVLVRTIFSAISSGTELLLYRGQFPDNMALDESIPSLSGSAEYPLKYGYSTVGEIVEVGEEIEDGWLGKKVFAFQPHTSYFVCETHTLQIIPDDLSVEDALFLPNMETAVNWIVVGDYLRWLDLLEHPPGEIEAARFIPSAVVDRIDMAYLTADQF